MDFLKYNTYLDFDKLVYYIEVLISVAFQILSGEQPVLRPAAHQPVKDRRKSGIW